MKSIIILVCLLYSLSGKSQTTKFYFPGEDKSIVTPGRREKAKYNLDQAYEAYNKGDLEKTRYYLGQSQDHLWKSGSFYYLLGKWCYDMKKYGSAKRYWYKGLKKYGCWECKELADKLLSEKK